MGSRSPGYLSGQPRYRMGVTGEGRLMPTVVLVLPVRASTTRPGPALASSEPSLADTTSAATSSQRKKPHSASSHRSARHASASSLSAS